MIKSFAMKKSKAEARPRVVVIGAGAMGSITVRDLVETAPPEFEIVVADFNEKAAKALAKSFKRKVEGVFVNATDVNGTAKVLSGAFAVITAVQHQFNLFIMQAALKAGAHYCDLGGLFHYTRKQLKLHNQFKKAGLTAVLGIGAAPGVVNVLARSAADTMEKVYEVHVKVGNIDRTVGRPSNPLGTSYSIQTILEEATTPAALFTNGKFTFVEAMSGSEETHYPAPVGVRRPHYTIHSEVATLPLSYKSKGIRECSFRIAFGDELEDRLRFVRALGLTSEKPLKVGRGKDAVNVVPRQVLFAMLAQQPKLSWNGKPDEYEILRVVVRGIRKGVAVEETVDCHTPGIPAWNMGVDVDTGCPPSIAVQMMYRGEISERGVLPPEVAIPADPFFRELAKRRMTVKREVRTLGAARKSA